MQAQDVLDILRAHGIAIPQAVVAEVLDAETQADEDPREADCDAQAAEREDWQAHGDDREEFNTCDKRGRPYLPRYNDAGEPNYVD